MGRWSWQNRLRRPVEFIGLRNLGAIELLLDQKKEASLNPVKVGEFLALISDGDQEEAPLSGW
jgi:hypothetical protein